MTARVGDLVSLSAWVARHPSEKGEVVGQVVRQSDIMSEVVTASGRVNVRTIMLTVVQPGHVGSDTHTSGGGRVQ